MCGICGLIGDREDKASVVARMLKEQIHRGPDGERVSSFERAALGFCRLSIIDLEGGMQPIFNEDGSKALVFNGEIYNYKELREELLQKGHSFTTQSDSETILHGFEEYGQHVVNHLRGMFAFAIWDDKKKRLFAARDFFGIKPFYYTMIDGCFVFASELKSILTVPGFERVLNEEAMEQYLSFQYSPMKETLFKGVFRLLPGSCLLFEKGKIRTAQYFDPMLIPEKGKTDRQIVDEIDAVMQDSVQKHMIADVEVGSFLSGGVDSSLIAALFNGDRTFSVGFMDENSQYNEMAYARELAKEKGLQFYTKQISTEEFWEAVPKVMYHLDEPSGDASAVALYFVAQEAARQVKVVNSGEGSDELFGGYTIYLEPRDISMVTGLPRPVRKAAGALAEKLPYGMKGRSFLIRGSKDVQERFIGNANIFSFEERRKLLKHPTDALPAKDLLARDYKRAGHLRDSDKMQYIDLKNWLPGDILQKADKMSMAHSLEVRVPFLDKEVFNVARRLSPEAKLRGAQTKYLFREAARRHLPEDTSKRRKLGFPVPIRVWLKEEPYYSIVKETFEGEDAQKLFHTEQLTALLDAHKKGERDNSRKIWTVYAFLVWYGIYFSGRAE